MPLTSKQIEAARHGVGPERLSDGNGLYLRLFPGGRKTFVYRTPVSTETRTWLTLGPFPELSLKSARERATVVAALFSAGRKVAEVRALLAGPEIGAASLLARPAPAPSDAPRRPLVPTFKEMTKIWFEQKREGLRSGKHIAQNWTTIETYVFPQLGPKRIDEIELNEIAEAIRPIWRTKHETAKRTLGRVREIFALAQIRGYRKDNPAQFDAKIALGKVRVVKKHHASLPFERMPEFWDWLETVRCVEEVRQATMLMILTAKRTGETRKAEWGFFDENLDIWTTPEELMKMGRAHRVPLSRQAAVVIRNMAFLTGSSAHVFARPRNKCGVLSENTIRKLVQRFEPTITGHGFRATFRTWARRQGRYSTDAMEFALAHEQDELEAAYQREDLLEERQGLMQDWADFITCGREPAQLGE